MMTEIYKVHKRIAHLRRNDCGVVECALSSERYSTSRQKSELTQPELVSSSQLYVSVFVNIVFDD